MLSRHGRPEHGLIAFDVRAAIQLQDVSDIQKRQDEIVLAIKAKLLQHRGLTERSDLAVTVNVLTYCPDIPAPNQLGGVFVASADSMADALGRCEPFDPQYLIPLNAAIERVANIRPKAKRPNAKTAESRGSILKKIEGEIANLDSWQKSAAIEIPDGPQRIRGLAGSGKTIVLALKAAYLHGQHPDWRIIVTFHTRALRQQFRRLIRRFYFEDYREDPDWDVLRIMHSFGSIGEPGVYSEVCQAHGQYPRNFGYAKRTYGYGFAFQGICGELLKAVEAAPKPICNVMLIDEAQDLPKEFLRIARLCTEHYRIVWAYDDLQNLGEYQLQSLRDTFGVDENGNQIVSLTNRPKQPREDIILPRCYRNTPWALVTAHALGSGIYRRTSGERKLVQHPDDPQLWQDIGYEVRDGRLELGRHVVLQRDPGASPSFFRELLKPDDAVQFLRFDDESTQLDRVATMIATNISTDELYPQDIIVVFPEALVAQKKAARFQQLLRERGIDSHVAGVTTSRDVFSIDGSVTISGPHRAKGNEAPMVYLLDCQYCASGPELIQRRNTLFTSVTRSRAWVRICGYGEGADILENEFNELKGNDFRLDFTIPTLEQLEKMRTQYRDITRDERKKVEKLEASLDAVLTDEEDSKVLLKSLPKELREKLRRVLSDEE